MKSCSWPCPGIFPAGNHLLCAGIPARIKLLLHCRVWQLCCSKCHQRGDPPWLAWALTAILVFSLCVTFSCAVELTSGHFSCSLDCQWKTNRTWHHGILTYKHGFKQNLLENIAGGEGAGCNRLQIKRSRDPIVLVCFNLKEQKLNSTKTWFSCSQTKNKQTKNPMAE